MLKPARNALIVEMVRAGHNGQAIADLFNLTRERVRQIAKNNGIASLKHKPPQPRVCPTCGGKKGRESKQCQECFWAARNMTLTCPSCGSERIISLSERRFRKSELCRPCYLASKRETRPCAICGEPITRLKSQFRGPLAFHSGVCLSEWKRRVWQAKQEAKQL